MATSLKEEAILKFLSNINWNKDKWSYEDIEEKMRRFLGERPTLDVEYIKEPLLLEGSTKSIIIDRISKISVIFTDTNDKIKKLNIPIL